MAQTRRGLLTRKTKGPDSNMDPPIKPRIEDSITILVDGILRVAEALDVRVEDVSLAQYENFSLQGDPAEAGQMFFFHGEKPTAVEWQMAKQLAMHQIQSRPPGAEPPPSSDMSLDDAEEKVWKGMGFFNVTSRKRVMGYTILSTLYAIGFSVSALILISLLTERSFLMGLAPSIIIPLLVTPLIAYTNLNQTFMLNEATKKIEALSRTDALTGLNNKRFFLELAEREMVIADRYNFHASLFVMDLDFFKVVNDTYGHLAGDQVLKEAAQIISQQVRRTDIAGRFGGEEFMVFLPHTTCEQALQVAGRIRSAIAENVVSFANDEIRVTTSIGVTSTESSVIDLGKLIHVADAALYQAKSAGRNRVEFSLDVLEGDEYTTSLISM